MEEVVTVNRRTKAIPKAFKRSSGHPSFCMAHATACHAQRYHLVTQVTPFVVNVQKRVQ